MAIITPAPLGETLKKREKFRGKNGGKRKRRKKRRERKKGRIRREKRRKEGKWRRKEEDNIFILYSLRNIDRIVRKKQGRIFKNFKGVGKDFIRWP